MNNPNYGQLKFFSSFFCRSKPSHRPTIVSNLSNRQSRKSTDSQSTVSPSNVPPFQKAHKAALISSDQLKLGLMLSDPYTICRTLIYNVYSLIQRDQFSCAFKLLKRVVHPYIRKHFGFKRQTEEYFILKGLVPFAFF